MIELRALGAILTLVVSVPGTLAETPMTADQFGARATGKTLYYSTEDGADFGAEQYLPGRRARWTFAGDICVEGYWYPEAEFICFIYDNNPKLPVCWTFYDRSAGLTAYSRDSPEAGGLIVTGEDTKPLPCHGPDVGV